MTQHKLIITEKPSVAYSIFAVLGATQRRNSYLEGNNYRISWCLGHLADLAEPETYDGKYAKWRISDLPIVPEVWRFQVDANKQKQFNILRDLMNRPDVSEIINACDAGREGELIFRTVYELAGCTKPVKRLWVSSMEHGELSPEAFMDGITEMVWDLVKTYTPVENAEALFPSGRKVVGKCPRCGGNVTESKSGFFCESNDCRFGLWRDNRFLTAKQITLTRSIAAALLKNRRAHLTGATLILKDNGEQLRYGLVPDHA